MLPVALTIAGSDPSGGAGLQADLKTFHAHDVYGMAVVTLLTVQNTRRVSEVHTMDPGLVRAQIGAVVEDIPPHAAKTGALGSAEIVRAVASLAPEFEFPLVVDPVMISKHGAPLLDEEAQEALRELLPHAALVTPNVPEAAALLGGAIRSEGQAREATRALAELGSRAVLLKGGHLEGEVARDFLWDGAELHELCCPRLETPHTHGTGCTYAAAITARLARGEALVPAVRSAKQWLHRAIETAPGLGAGQGPLNHQERA